MDAGQDGKVGGLIECGISWVSNCSNSSSNSRKCPTYRCWNFMCWINHRHVRITSINYGKIFNFLHKRCTLLVKNSHISRKLIIFLSWQVTLFAILHVISSHGDDAACCIWISHGTDSYHSSFSKEIHFSRSMVYKA